VSRWLAIRNTRLTGPRNALDKEITHHGKLRKPRFYLIVVVEYSVLGTLLAALKTSGANYLITGDKDSLSTDTGTGKGPSADWAPCSTS